VKPSVLWAGCAAVAAAVACAFPSAAAPNVRVQLLHDRLDVVLSSDGGLAVRPYGFDLAATMLEPEITTVLDVQAQPGGLVLADAVEIGQPIVVEPLSGSQLAVNGKEYRGSAIVQPSPDGSLSVVNIVDIDQYLDGVVAAEMPASWPQPALEAQAIVARSYALAKFGNPQHPTYDVQAGEQDQVYGGVAAETPASSTAVEGTRGIVLVSGGQIATAYYSACDGGYTSDGSPLEDPEPYLQVKTDPYCPLSPYMRWTASVPLARFEAAFAAKFGNVGEIKAVQVGTTDASGRAKTIVVTGTIGPKIISGPDFRLLAGQHLVKSLRIISIILAGDSLMVDGAGFGHGVGLCQYGARGMAIAGYGAADIVRFYYPGAELTSLVER